MLLHFGPLSGVYPVWLRFWWNIGQSVLGLEETAGMYPKNITVDNSTNVVTIETTAFLFIGFFTPFL